MRDRDQHHSGRKSRTQTPSKRSDIALGPRQCAERDAREAKSIEAELLKRRAMQAEAGAQDEFTNDEAAKKWLAGKRAGAFAIQAVAYKPEV